MKTSQLRFFEVLLIEENRNKSRKEISKLAGYNDKKTSEWYRVIKDNRFVELLKSMNVKIICEAKKQDYLPDIINGMDVLWMTIPQRKFLKVLSIEENRNKSRTEICELVGYDKNATQWYTAIKDKKFVELLKSMDVNIVCESYIINNIDVSWMTVSQRKFLKVVTIEENRIKSVKEICTIAGYSKSRTNQWYEAIKDKRFFELLKSMSVKVICEIDTISEIINGVDVSWMTIAQRNFFKVLSIEENRDKLRQEVCELAGHTQSTWYQCIKNERYAEILKSMNVRIICEPKFMPSVIDGMDVSWMTIPQRKIYQVLTIKKNREKSKYEICKLAGYTKNTAHSGDPWYISIKNERYAELLKSMNVKAICDVVYIPNVINGMDVSWMTITQRRFFKVLCIKENRSKTISEIYELAGYSKKGGNTAWYIAIADKKFADLLKSIKIDLKRKKTDYPPNHQIKYLDDIDYRKNYIENNDEWDMRVLFRTYPRHMNPHKFIVDFTGISNISIRKVVRNYFINRLNNWDASTFATVFNKLIIFLDCMYRLFPSVNTFFELEREKHIKLILKELQSKYCNSNAHYNRILNEVQNMFYYMINTESEDAPDIGLLNKYDKKKEDYSSKQKPIPPDVKNQLDNYISYTIIPLLEKGEPTPIVPPELWDMIIITRYTGRRTGDVCHLIAEDKKGINNKDKNKKGRNRECLQYDLDGEPMLYLDHRIAKIKKDLMITITHLEDSRGINIVEQAVLRQKKRVENLLPASDGYKYLFREKKRNIKNSEDSNFAVDLPLYSIIRINLEKICNNIPLKNRDGSIYNISMHQFRHTVASEMIDAGIDIWAVKEFLGHDSIAMTEKYIQVYKDKIKKEFKEQLMKSDASDIKSSLPKEEELFTSKWVKNKIMAVIEHGDGCCEHIYHIPACPHMECKICRKKKIYPRHLKVVKNTIESFITHRENALELGLIEKSKEFDEVVKYYTVALQIITKDEVFDAEKHFYNK